MTGTAATNTRFCRMEEVFIKALGTAVIAEWGKLPQDIQHALFEAAVLAGHKTERDESLREQLAQFLHEQHPRTVHPVIRDIAAAHRR